MDGKRGLLIAVVLAIVGRLGAEDTELWLQTGQRHPWGERTTLEILEVAKFRADASQLAEWFAEGGPVFAINERWGIAPWMHAGNVRSGAGWSYELEPSVNALYRRPGKWVSLAARARLEYHERGDAHNGGKVRGRFVLAAGDGLNSAVKPYLSEELYDDFRVGRVNQNRLFVGAQFPLRREWSGNAYFGWRSDFGAGRWTHRRVIGLSARWPF